MKRILSHIALALPLLAAVSCNEFLDELPDKRAELNNVDKIAQILVSAYPNELPTLMFEVMSDNVDDNGVLFNTGDVGDLQSRAYHWEDIPEAGWDDTKQVWESCYKAIAAANQALAGIEDMNDPQATNGVKSEALLCRAFAHFVLVNTFCMAYNPQTSETDMGIPFMEEAETTVSPKYERGTVAGVYAKIDADVDAALKIFSDSHLKTPKFHFNKRAAYAFAARFYLNYGKWDKVVEYATEALGPRPAETLRDFTKYEVHAVVGDWNLAYVNVDEPANIMLMPQKSVYARMVRGETRYMHNRRCTYKTLWQNFPWGNSVNGAGNVWGSNSGTVLYLPKVFETFDLEDAVAETGQPHTVLTHFTTDETLACRAEAHVMLKEYDLAMADLNIWYAFHSPNHSTYTIGQITDYYGTEHSVGQYVTYEVPVMESRHGVEAGTQAHLLGAVLAVRRFEGVFEGLRFMDIKRHGIQVKHNKMTSSTDSETLTLLPNDPRTAIQLPASVISAGLPANPR